VKYLVNIGILIYFTGVRIAALFNPKARKMIRAQKGLFQRYSSVFPSKSKVVWFHASSLGEFEQGRSVIESWREKREGDFILLTFFSPSGYEIKKDYPFADYVDYLPFDSANYLRKLIRIINPSSFVLIKYDFWPNLLSSLSEFKTDVYLISGLFRQDHFFFKWYGKYFLKLLSRMKGIFVQNEESMSLLKAKNISQVKLAGDTRIDRVFSLAKRNEEIEGIESFITDHKVIIGGSSWETEEKLLAQFFYSYSQSEKPVKIKIILAPHSIKEERLRHIEEVFENATVRLSEWRKNPEFYLDKIVLVIDTIGLLSRLYRYADVAIIGGGFGKSIHNILEPASYGLPILFGPNYSKFPEAKMLLKNGGAFAFKNYSEISRILGELLINESGFSKAGAASRAFVNEGAGATALITSYLLENP